MICSRYVPPPHINRTSGEHVTVGQSLTLSCTITVDWGVMVRLSWQLPNKYAVAPRLHQPEPISRNVSIGGSHLKVRQVLPWSKDCCMAACAQN